jgi:hypothetical protein
MCTEIINYIYDFFDFLSFRKPPEDFDYEMVYKHEYYQDDSSDSCYINSSEKSKYNRYSDGYDML